MIIEQGNSAEFKTCLLDNIVSVRCDQCGNPIMVLDSVPAHDHDKLMEVCGNRLCCLTALTEDWLARMEEITQKLLKSKEARTLYATLKLSKHLFRRE